jgi:hypothetical protein
VRGLSQRVWFVVYPPEEERRLVNRIPEFEFNEQRTGVVCLSAPSAFGGDTLWEEKHPVAAARSEGSWGLGNKGL